MKKKEMLYQINHMKLQMDWLLEHFINFVKEFKENGCPHPYPIPIFSKDFKVEDRKHIERFCR